MGDRWELTITDLDSVHTIWETELRIVYILRLNAPTSAEAERTALDQWRKGYASSAGHGTEVKSSQVYQR